VRIAAYRIKQRIAISGKERWQVNLVERGLKSVTPQQDIEIAIRTANLIKSLSQLINVGSAVTARLLLNEAVPQVIELDAFINRCAATSSTSKIGDTK